MKLGRYDIIGTLGEGGNAKVLVASAADGTRVVLKVPLRADRDQLERVRDEARVGLRLHHPAIVDTLDLFEHNGRPILVVEHIEGASLAQIRRTGALTPAAAARVGRQVAEALTVVHDATSEDGTPLGMLHRDVTPANILIAASGDAKLIDLGIARSTETQARATEAGAVRGTLRYLAPELLEGQKHDAACDIWALGVVLWEAVLGRRALIGDDREILSKILRADVMSYRPGEVLDPRLHDALAALIAKPQMRLQKAKAVVNVFTRLANAFGDGQSDLAAAAQRAQELIPKATQPLGERTKKLLSAVAGGTPRTPTPTATPSPRPVTMPPQKVVSSPMPGPTPPPTQPAMARVDLDAPLDEGAATIQMPAMDWLKKRDEQDEKAPGPSTEETPQKPVRPVTADDINVNNLQARFAPTERAMPAVQIPSQPAQTQQIPAVTEVQPVSEMAPVTAPGPDAEDEARARAQADALAEQAAAKKAAELAAAKRAAEKAAAEKAAAEKAAAEKAAAEKAAAEKAAAEKAAAEKAAAQKAAAEKAAAQKAAAQKAAAEKAAAQKAAAEKAAAQKAAADEAAKQRVLKAAAASDAADVKSTQMLHGGMLQKEMAKARAEEQTARASTGPTFAAVDPDGAAAAQPSAGFTPNDALPSTVIEPQIHDDPKPLAAPPVQPGAHSAELAPTAVAGPQLQAAARATAAKADVTAEGEPQPEETEVTPSAPAAKTESAAHDRASTAVSAPVADISQRQLETERMNRSSGKSVKVVKPDDAKSKKSKKSKRAAKRTGLFSGKNKAAPDAQTPAPGPEGFGQMTVTQAFYATDIEQALQSGDLGQEVFDEQFKSKRPMVIAVVVVAVIAFLVAVAVAIAIGYAMSDDPEEATPPVVKTVEPVADDKKVEAETEKKAEEPKKPAAKKKKKKKKKKRKSKRKRS